MCSCRCERWAYSGRGWGAGQVRAVEPDHYTAPLPRPGGPSSSFPTLASGPAPLLGHTILAPGPGARPGAPAPRLPRRHLGRLPATATAPWCRPLQLSPAPGLQCLCAVPALPAEPLPLPPRSPPDSCISDAAAAAAGARAQGQESGHLGPVGGWARAPPGI